MRRIHRLRTPTAKQVAARADEIESQIDDPSNDDDPKWLQRKVDVLRCVAAMKEKARSHKQSQRRR